MIQSSYTSFVRFGVLLISELLSSGEMAEVFCSPEIGRVGSNIRKGSDTVNSGGQQAFLFLLKDIFKRAWQRREKKSALHCLSLTLDGYFPAALFCACNCASSFHAAILRFFWGEISIAVCARLISTSTVLGCSM